MTVDATTRLQMAHALVDVGRKHEAADLVRQVLAGEPGHARALCALARALDGVDNAGMLVAADAAVAAAPEDDYAAKVRSVALRRVGRPTEALPAARRAVALDPADQANHWELAKVHLALGRTVDAYQAALRVRELDPTAPSTFYLFTDVYEAAGEYRTARAEYAAGLRAHPLHEPLLGGLAYFERLTRHHRAAARHYRAGLARLPTDVNYHHGLTYNRARMQLGWALLGAVLAVQAALAHALGVPPLPRAAVALALLAAYAAGLVAAHRGIGWAGRPPTGLLLRLGMPAGTMLVAGLAPQGSGVMTVAVTLQLLLVLHLEVELGVPALSARLDARRKQRAFRRAIGGPPPAPPPS